MVGVNFSSHRCTPTTDTITCRVETDQRNGRLRGEGEVRGVDVGHTVQTKIVK